LLILLFLLLLLILFILLLLILLILLLLILFVLLLLILLVLLSILLILFINSSEEICTSDQINLQNVKKHLKHLNLNEINVKFDNF
jgi:hypothetical protein